MKRRREGGILRKLMVECSCLTFKARTHWTCTDAAGNDLTYSTYTGHNVVNIIICKIFEVSMVPVKSRFVVLNTYCDFTLTLL